MTAKPAIAVIGAGSDGRTASRWSSPRPGIGSRCSMRSSRARDRVRADTGQSRGLGLDPRCGQCCHPACSTRRRPSPMPIWSSRRRRRISRSSKRLFADLERCAPAGCDSRLQHLRHPDRPDHGKGLRDKTRALGTHWWNPPYLVPLVEVIRTVRQLRRRGGGDADACCASVGKTAVEVKKDVPGFIGNRLQHALWREAIALVADGVCDARTVDDVVKSSFGARLAVLGPLENADLVGTDLTQSIHGYRAARARSLDGAVALSRSPDRRRPARLQVRRGLPQVDAGAAERRCGSG